MATASPRIRALAAPFPGSVTNNIRSLLADGKPRTSADIAVELCVPLESIHTALTRLRNAGVLDVIEGKPGQKQYHMPVPVEREPRGVMGWYRRLLSDTREHSMDELLTIGGTREDLPRRIWELRSGGMNIVTVRYPNGNTAYQWRPQG